MLRHWVVLIALALSACGLPRDPDGTLERVQGGSMRVGIVHAEPWTEVGEVEPGGVEPALVRELARELGAEIEWVSGPEADVLEAIELGRLDLAVGGFTADNPWSSRVTFIQPYYIHGDDEHVMAVPHGENGWIVHLERFLRSRRSRIPDLMAEARG